MRSLILKLFFQFCVFLCVVGGGKGVKRKHKSQNIDSKY